MATRVYMLKIIYPPGITWDNPPENWEPQFDEQEFTFPRERKYLTKKAALDKARTLINWGCQVTLMISEPVIFYPDKFVPLNDIDFTEGLLL